MPRAEARGSLRAPGMTQTPFFWLKAGSKPAYMRVKCPSRFIGKWQRRQGKGISENGVSGGSMRQNPCT